MQQPTLYKRFETQNGLVYLKRRKWENQPHYLDAYERKNREAEGCKDVDV